MDISRELLSLHKRALEHSIQENNPTLRMVFIDESTDTFEVTPPYEEPTTCLLYTSDAADES
mgnify:CR=1 FL=1